MQSRADHRRVDGHVAIWRRVAGAQPFWAMLALVVADVCAVVRVYCGYEKLYYEYDGVLNLGAYGGMVVAAIVGIWSLWSRLWPWALILPMLWIASFYLYYWLDAESGRVTRGFLHTNPAIVGHGHLLCMAGLLLTLGVAAVRVLIDILNHLWPGAGE